jgi:hypothetical protein
MRRHLSKDAGYESRISVAPAIQRARDDGQQQQKNTGVAGLFCHSLRCWSMHAHWPAAQA